MIAAWQGKEAREPLGVEYVKTVERGPRSYPGRSTWSVRVYMLHYAPTRRHLAVMGAEQSPRTSGREGQFVAMNSNWGPQRPGRHARSTAGSLRTQSRSEEGTAYRLYLSAGTRLVPRSRATTTRTPPREKSSARSGLRLRCSGTCRWSSPAGVRQYLQVYWRDFLGTSG